MSEPKPDRPLHESEQDQIGSTLSLLNALGAIGHSERKIVGVLITWGLLYDDMQGMDDLDGSVLAALMAIRDEPGVPNQDL